MNNGPIDKATALAKVSTINEVDGFDPTPFAVEYVDLNTGEKRLRLPVMAQIAWFRLKYPEGRIAKTVMQVKDFFVATARVYAHYIDPVECFLAEATVSRGYLSDKPTVSPREWAQTAAVGIALRDAGFGLQFHAAGDSFDMPAVNELSDLSGDTGTPPSSQGAGEEHSATPAATSPQTQVDAQLGTELETQPQMDAEYHTDGKVGAMQTEETPLQKAMKLPCPITQNNLKGKTLGDLITLDPKALAWIANRFHRNPEISAGAKLICEQALNANA